jgi:hypothetical protein
MKPEADGLASSIETADDCYEQSRDHWRGGFAFGHANQNRLGKTKSPAWCLPG